MKKKFWFICLIFIFFIAPSDIYAKDGNDYLISYDITNFSIDSDGDTIRFSGWSFLNHMDNYGGINMNTWIVAYNSKWNSAWNNNPTAANSSCSKNKHCYPITAKIGKVNGHVIDLYYVRCTDSGCNNSTQKIVVDNLKNNEKMFEGDSCTTSTTDAGVKYPSSHCAYYNVGFNASMSIDRIVAKLGSDSPIKFRIITKVLYKETSKNLSKKGKSEVDSADIGVVKSSCSSIFGNKCKNEDKTYRKTIPKSDDSGTYTFTRAVKIGGINTKIKFTAGNARRFTSNDTSGSSGTFSEGLTYDLQEVKGLKWYKNYKGNNKGEFWGRMYQLYRKGEGSYWAWSAWTKPTGALTLDLSDEFKPTELIKKECDPETEICCEDLSDYCIGGGCEFDPETCEFSSTPPAGSANYTCSKTSRVNACDSANYSTSCNHRLSTKYYYRLSSSEVSEVFRNVTLKAGSYYSVKQTGNYYYFPITFYGNVSFNQNAKLALNFTNKQITNSGRSFVYSFDYNVSSYWNYLNYHQSGGADSTSPNNTYDAYLSNIMVQNGGSIYSATVRVSLRNGERLYKNANPNSWVTYNLDFYRNFVADKVKDDHAWSIDEDVNVVNFADSNDVKSHDITSDAGKFKCDDYSVEESDWNAGVTRSVKCSYKLNKAYFKNDGSGHVVYHETDGYNADVNDGSLYYIPANLKTDSTFDFQASATSLSLIDLISYSYTPTCNVKANNNFSGGRLKYRPIDTSNPFPKGIIPKNWQEYLDSNAYGLKRVTEHSFDAISYQTTKLDNSVKQNLGQLKNQYGGYDSYGDMYSDGTALSKVVHNSNLFSITNGNHCKVHQFDPTCDPVQGS